MLKSAFAGLATATFVVAAPLAASAAVGPVAQINVAIAPELAAKTRDFSRSDFETLKDELRRAVERQLSRKGALTSSGGSLDLVITNVKETRPTIEQMSRKVGLSYQSFGLGGVEIAGSYHAPNGAVTPINYRWYENDIRQASYGWTFQAAADGMSRFARTLTAAS